MDTLLDAKLLVPSASPTVLARPRLIDRLADGLRRKVALIAAPAGWGKTTLLSAFAASRSPGSVAWVSLDAGDCDPSRFWAYVISAVQRVQPGIGESSLTLLRSHEPAPLEMVLTPLLNELARLESDVILILDDYHVIDTATIHRGLAFVVDHLPPHVHLFIATRADPPLALARLRARGDLTELRADDLRLTHTEADAFLRDLMGLSLSDSMIAALEARTEGWVAALQLAALALRNQAKPSSFIEAFSGSYRFVADYLVEEVVLQQPAEIQEFLLRTSILDRMCASLCGALDDQLDPREAQRLLEQLDDANLFLIPLDGERRWYRYHHLFADLLRARLHRNWAFGIADLHRRASEWFERAGLVEEAIQHALQTEDFARAADLLEPIADQLWTRGQMATLNALLGRLPDEIVCGRSQLLIAQAGALFYFDSRQIEAIEAALRRAEAALAASAWTDHEQRRLSARIGALRAAQASWHDNTGRTIDLARQALENLDSDDAPWRLLALTSLGMASTLRGDPEVAIGPLVDAARLAHDAGATYVGLGPRLWLGLAHVAGGKLHEANASFLQGLDSVKADNLTSANFLIGLGCWVEYERNELDSAERHLDEGLRLAGRQQWPWVVVDACATLTKIKRLHGDRHGVADLLQRMEQHVRNVEVPWTWMAPRLAASVANAYLAFGQVQQAAEWTLALEEIDDSTAIDLSVEIERVALARVLNAQRQWSRALAVLDPLASGAAAHGRWGRFIDIQILRSLALEPSGRHAYARAALEQALVRAQPEGYVRRFVDEGPAMKALLMQAVQRNVVPTYVARLLHAFTDSSGATPGSMPIAEALSDRERDVLRLLVAGCSGPEIAETLVVAPSTVRTHVKSIYGKLDVHTREQAIARATELKFL